MCAAAAARPPAPASRVSRPPFRAAARRQAVVQARAHREAADTSGARRGEHCTPAGEQGAGVCARTVAPVGNCAAAAGHGQHKRVGAAGRDEAVEKGPEEVRRRPRAAPAALAATARRSCAGLTRWAAPPAGRRTRPTSRAPSGPSTTRSRTPPPSTPSAPAPCSGRRRRAMGCSARSTRACWRARRHGTDGGRRAMPSPPRLSFALADSALASSGRG